MSASAKQQELVALFGTAPIKKVYGMDFHYDDEAGAVFTLPYNQNFDHALGGIHGGVYCTMLDNAGWFTVAQYYEGWIGTTDIQTRLLKPVKETDLVATGKLVRAGRQMAVAEMELRTRDGDLVAVGSASFNSMGAKFLGT